MNRSLADTPIDRLAHFVSTLDYDSLPASVIDKTKVHIADTLGLPLPVLALASSPLRSVTAFRGPVKSVGTGLCASRVMPPFSMAVPPMHSNSMTRVAATILALWSCLLCCLPCMRPESQSTANG